MQSREVLEQRPGEIHLDIKPRCVETPTPTGSTLPGSLHSALAQQSNLTPQPPPPAQPLISRAVSQFLGAKHGSLCCPAGRVTALCSPTPPNTAHLNRNPYPCSSRPRSLGSLLSSNTQLIKSHHQGRLCETRGKFETKSGLLVRSLGRRVPEKPSQCYLGGSSPNLCPRILPNICGMERVAKLLPCLSKGP